MVFHSLSKIYSARLADGCTSRLIALVRRRAASVSISRAIPLNNMLMPTNLPMAQAELAGIEFSDELSAHFPFREEFACEGVLRWVVF